MRIAQTSRAVYRFRKLAAFPFGYMARASVPSLPFAFMSAAVFALPALIDAAAGNAFSGAFAGIVDLALFAGVAFCQCAIFCLTLKIAVVDLVPEARTVSGAGFRVSAVILKQMWPTFVGVLAGLVSFSLLFSLVLGLPFSAGFAGLRESGDLSAALKILAGHFLLEFINPLFWIFSFAAAFYFRLAAKRSVAAFESMLDALKLRPVSAISLAPVVDQNRSLFASLVSVPHFLFGLAGALLGAAFPGVGLTRLFTAAADYSSGPLYPLASALALTALLSILFSLVAGFIAVIWLAAAQIAGIVDLAAAADAGFVSRRPKSEAKAPARGAAIDQRPGQRPLAGSAPAVVERRSKLL